MNMSRLPLFAGRPAQRTTATSAFRPAMMVQQPFPPPKKLSAHCIPPRPHSRSSTSRAYATVSASNCEPSYTTICYAYGITDLHLQTLKNLGLDQYLVQIDTKRLSPKDDISKHEDLGFSLCMNIRQHMLQVQEFGFQCTPFHIRYPGLRDVCVFQIAAPAQECETRAKIVKTLRSADSVQAARQVSVLMPGTEPEIAFNEQSRDLLVIKKNSSNEGIEEAFGTVQLAVGSDPSNPRIRFRILYESYRDDQL